MNLISLNVKGLNSPQKRKKVFALLEKQKCEVICLQESHIKSEEIRLIKNKKLGKEFVASMNKRKKGVIIYVNEHLNSKEIFKDNKGHLLGVEINWKGKKILVVGIYSPLENKAKFYEELNKKLLDFNYDNVILLGDFNGVINPKTDRKSTKKIKDKQGKLPKTFFNLIKDHMLIDVWRHLYGSTEGFTFYSNSHKSLARIDLMLVSKPLLNEIKSMEILPRLISDHNPQILMFKDHVKRKYWRLNEELLKEPEIIDKAKKNNYKLF